MESQNYSHKIGLEQPGFYGFYGSYGFCLRRKNDNMEKKQSKSKKPNIKVIIYSIIALGFVVLTFLVDWLFIIGAVILIYLNQKELMKKKSENF